jgi:hypothetical protein
MDGKFGEIFELPLLFIMDDNNGSFDDSKFHAAMARQSQPLFLRLYSKQDISQQNNLAMWKDWKE